jgi:hypothetical protein
MRRPEALLPLPHPLAAAGARHRAKPGRRRRRRSFFPSPAGSSLRVGYKAAGLVAESGVLAGSEVVPGG